MKNQQQENTYNLTTSSGIHSNIYIVASNINEAYKIAKQKYPNEIYFGKLKRCYSGGVRG